MSVDVEGLPSEEKLEANTDDEADSSKKLSDRQLIQN